MVLKSKCPVCQESRDTYVMDKGKKFLQRLVARNNRFACRECKVTWRRKSPGYYQHLEKRSE